MANSVQEIVFKGRNNDFEIVISLGGQTVDFTAITRMIIEMGGETVDSNIDAGSIEWDANGVITFDLGSTLISKGSHSAVVVAYDPLHANGQVICHPKSSASLNVLVL